MGKIAFLFPGQGSQSVGMVRDIFDTYPEAKAYLAAADERLGFSLSKLITHGPQDTLRLTENAQPPILTASMAPLSQLIKAGIHPDYVAGHSLGEYSALACAGALSFEDAVFAVRNRGRHLRNVTQLNREVRGHRVHVVGQIFPGARHTFYIRLTAQLSFRTHFFRHTGNLSGK